MRGAPSSCIRRPRCSLDPWLSFRRRAARPGILLVRGEQEVGASLFRDLARLFAAPLLDGRVVAVHQYVRHLEPAELPRTRVMRRLEEAVLERLGDGRLRVADHAGEQARDAVEEDHRGHLPAGYDV